MNVAVIGASNKASRISNQAITQLQAAGHKVFPVNPNYQEIQGLKVTSNITELTEPIHTITLYVQANISTQLIEDILALKPQRIICNPGAENSHLEAKAKTAKIEVVNACTLVMLSKKVF